jgi:hypothetical protein
MRMRNRSCLARPPLIDPSPHHVTGRVVHQVPIHTRQPKADLRVHFVGANIICGMCHSDRDGVILQLAGLV